MSELEQTKAASPTQTSAAASIARSPGKAAPTHRLPSGLRSGLEASLGTDLSSVNLHTGAESAESAKGMGARAYTIGQDIHFGAGMYNPGTAAGDRLIAHEVAHTVQQRGATAATAQTKLEVSSPGDAHEREADNFADFFMSGLGAGLTAQLAPVSAGVVSRQVIHRDAEGEGGGGLAGMALDFVLDRISDAQTLLSALGTVSASIGRRVINTLVTRSPDILISFITLNPVHALAIYAVRQLPTDKIREMLESIDVAAAKRVIEALAGAGLLVVIGPIIFALAPERARQIIGNLDRNVLTPLFRTCNEEAKQFVTQILDGVWPVGIGVAVSGGIGATFGYPIYAGGDANFNLSRSTRENFKFLRRGEARVGADTGAGAGVFIGTGGRTRGTGSSSEGTQSGGGGGGGIGIGATAGAQAQAGVKMIVHQEFSFPVFEDNAFLSMLLAITGNDTSTSFMIGRLLFDCLADIDPMLYNTLTKMEAKVYGDANASAEAGVRTGGDNTIDGGQTWGREGAADTGTQSWWARVLNLCASLSGHAGAEGGIGVSFQQTFGSDRSAGPEKIDLDVSVEASAALSIVHSIPLLSAHIPQLPQLDGGVGVKLMFELRPAGADRNADPQVRFKGQSVYVKSGEMDLYAGAASETSVQLGSLAPENFASIDAFLNNIQGGVEFTRRFSAGGTLGRKYLRAAGRQRTFNAMLPAEYRTFGFTLEGYLDFKATITVDQVRRIFRSIYEAGRQMFEGENAMQRLYTDVLTFFSTGQAPAYIANAARDIANTMLEGVRELKLHGQAGLRVAAGAQAAEGAKVRLHGSAGAMITMDYDILAAIGGRDGVTVDDIEQLLRSAVDTAAGYIEFDGTDAAGGAAGD